MNVRLLLAMTLALLVSNPVHASAAPPERTTAKQPTASQPLPRLVFFMNPNGAPCQLQDKVLRDMTAELKGRAEVVYYKTTVEQDLPQFGRYGIRSLPVLLVTDATGREQRRAPPGIRSAEEIRLLLKP